VAGGVSLTKPKAADYRLNRNDVINTSKEEVER